MFYLAGVILCAVGGNIKCSADVLKAQKEKLTVCSYSTEAQRMGLETFLHKVKATYYKINPNNVVYDPDSTPASIRRDFGPYNPHPNAIRERTDAARSLYREINKLNKKADGNKLKPRERKAIAQVKHFLKSNFGAPYDENYYAGDWMLGPSTFCWQPICSVGKDLQAHFTYQEWGIQPKTVADVKFVTDQLKRLKDSLMQYIENMKYGIKAGFVRSQEDCLYGLYSIQRAYLKVSQYGPTGTCSIVLDCFFWLHFLSILCRFVYNHWHNVSMQPTFINCHLSLKHSTLQEIQYFLNTVLCIRSHYRT